MDSLTVAAYDRDAREMALTYRSIPSPVVSLCLEWFKPGCRVLDVGAGSGRDMAALHAAGFEVTGVEPSRGLIQEAEAEYPALKGRIQCSALPLAEAPCVYGGILCCAVLMHLPADSWFEAVYSLREALEPGGRIIVSISLGHEVDPNTRRDMRGRFFGEPPPESVQLLFERAGFRTRYQREAGDTLGRGIAWHTFVFERPAGGALQPLDTIQRIISGESKTATYKLALLRALSEIATKDFNRAVFLDDGQIGVPLELVTKKWLRYYWPLFESARFIPGANGERPGAPKPLMFRKAMTALIAGYRGLGGYPRFYSDWISGALSPGADKALDEALKRIRRAIVDGPVFYAARGTFAYDAARRVICVPFELWREFIQLGAWIEPAVILEWAEQTRRMSKGEISVGDALSLLTAEMEFDRSVQDVRAAFANMPDLRCVWSDRGLMGQPFDVDHAIPFTIWHCNDLWNLLPASPKVNNEKRDRLPTLDLIRRSEERIVGCWRFLEVKFPARFRNELQRLLAGETLPSQWERKTLNRFQEAVETTATLRRIDPSARFGASCLEKLD